MKPLTLTPWAAQALTNEDRAALIARIPDGYRLRVGGGRPRHWSMYLVGPGDVGCIASTNYAATWQTAADTVFVSVPLSYMRCSACGKRLGDYGECDSCTFDESEASRG